MTDEETLVTQIKKYRNKLVRAIDGAVLGLFIDNPVENFSERDKGFEEGLEAARKAIGKFVVKK